MHERKVVDEGGSSDDAEDRGGGQMKCLSCTPLKKWKEARQLAAEVGVGADAPLPPPPITKADGRSFGKDTIMNE